MKIPSITHVLKNTRDTFLRYPFSVLSAVIALIISLCINHKIAHISDRATGWVLSSMLGIPLFFAAQLYANASALRRGSQLMINLTLLGLLVALGLTYERPTSQLYMFRYVQFSLAVHLLVSFIAFKTSERLNAFWQFNKTLFLRFITSYIFTMTFVAGVALAFWGSSYLLGFKVYDKMYVDLWFFGTFVFNTIFYLGGLPENLSALEEDTSYPTVIKVFTQYLLIPLVTIYLLILYAYMGKIIFHLSWPKGTVGYLVSGVSVLGIFSLLLVYPVTNLDENKWIRFFSRTFYLALLPLVVLMLLGLHERISAYGITERRYFMTVIAFWITGISVYFSFGQKKNIKVIPITLCILAFLTALGPWSAYAVSRRSQMNCFIALLTKNGNLVNGQIAKPANALNFNEQKRIFSILSYFQRMHGLQILAPLVGETSPSTLSIETISKKIGLEYSSQYGYQNDGESFYFQVDKTEGDWNVIDVHGYDYIIDIPSQYISGDTAFSIEPSFHYVLTIEPKSAIISMKKGDTKILSFNCADQLLHIYNGRSNFLLQKPVNLTFVTENGTIKGKLLVTYISGVIKEVPEIQSFHGSLLLKKI